MLKYRHEIKFYVNFHQYIILRQRLQHLLKRDRYAGADGNYHIRSLYFDDIDNKALTEKLAGTRDRIKYRLRIYNLQDGVIHFEKKIKMKDWIAKVKEPLHRETASAVIAGQYEALVPYKKPLLDEVYREMKHGLLRPKVIVDYVREAYISAAGNVRITFDKQLRTGLHSTALFQTTVPTMNAIDEGFIIMEVKYDEFIPDPVRMALQLEGLRRQSASKYVICRKFTKENEWEDQ